MKTNAALHIIFAFFLGLVVVAFVGIAVNTFYPEPAYLEVPASAAEEQAWSAAYGQWQLVTGIILLICATLILAVSLFLPDAHAVLSNGILLGGVFTMVYAVGLTFAVDTSWLRLIVVTVALAVTIAIGYLSFVRGRHRSREVISESASVSEISGRIAVLENKLDALAKALRD